MAKTNPPATDLLAQGRQNLGLGGNKHADNECSLGYKCPCFEFENGHGCPAWLSRLRERDNPRGVSARVV